MDLTLLISSIPLLISSIFLLISSISQLEILKHSRAHSSDLCLLSLNPTPQEKHLVFAPELVLNTNSPWRIHNFWPLSRLWILDLNDNLPSGQLQLAVNMHLKPNTSKTQLKPPNTALVSPSQWAGATIRQITQAKNLKIHPLLLSSLHSQSISKSIGSPSKIYLKCDHLLLLFNHSVVPNYSQLPWTAHARPPCLSPSPRACSSSCPLNQWRHPTISSSCPLLLLPSSFPSIGIFSNESALRIRCPEHWSFSFSISPSKEYSGLITFRIDWFHLLGVQGTLKSLLQHHSSKASILWCSAFFMVQLSLYYWKNHSFDYMDSLLLSYYI